MNKELELWQFIADRLQNGERVMLLVVATSSGSSPGRPGYKMAVAENGELIGSIGVGVMEIAGPQHTAIDALRRSVARVQEPYTANYPLTALGPQRFLLAKVAPAIDIVRALPAEAIQHDGMVHELEFRSRWFRKRVDSLAPDQESVAREHLRAVL